MRLSWLSAGVERAHRPTTDRRTGRGRPALLVGLGLALAAGVLSPTQVATATTTTTTTTATATTTTTTVSGTTAAAASDTATATATAAASATANASGAATTAAATAEPSTFPGYTSVSPTRVLDTRSGTGAPKAAVGAGQSIVVKVTGVAGIPATGVGAVVVNVTAVSPTATSFLSVYPSGAARPTTSTLNLAAGRSVANLVIATPGQDGAVTIYNGAGSVHVLADVSGYFATTSAYAGQTPVRILDTRRGLGATKAAVSGGHSIDLAVTGQGGVPASGVVAVAMNVTAVGATASSFVTVYPTGTTRPNTSNLNLAPGRTAAVLVVARLGAGGKVTLYNGAGNIHLIADVTGWFAAGLGYHPLTPTRIVDTRKGGLNGAGTLQPQILGMGGIPSSNVSAVVLSVTAVSPKAPGYMIVWGSDQNAAGTSNISYAAGGTVANLVIARIGPHGWVNIYNSTPGTYLLVDVVGWLATNANPWQAVSAEGAGSCGIRVDGTLWCWGKTASTAYPDPTQQGSVSTWASVTGAAGNESECALRTDRTLWCWGANTSGEVGIGSKTVTRTPTQVDPGSTWASVSVGMVHSCGVRTDGTLWCWGSHSFGMLGTADGVDHLTPAQVGSETTWTDVSAANYHTCAVRADGTLWCWGLASQLGIPGSGDQPSPAQVGTATSWATVSAGIGRSCATRTDGTLWCWAIPNSGAATFPVQIGAVTTWSSVAVGGNNTCGVRTDHTLWCWGANAWGQLGVGDTIDRPSLTQVAGTEWASVTMGQLHTCALRADTTLWCWGYNSSGELGVGDTTNRTLPTQVS